MSIYKIFFFLLIVVIFLIDVKCINDIQLNMSFVILLEFQMLDQRESQLFIFYREVYGSVHRSVYSSTFLDGRLEHISCLRKLRYIIYMVIFES